jgi:5-methylcytosine-specific restriction protein B
MDLEGLTEVHLRQAAREIDRNGVPVKRESTRYLVEIDGKKYPPKLIVCIAVKFLRGFQLDSKEIHGDHAKDLCVNFGLRVWDGKDRKWLS